MVRIIAALALVVLVAAGAYALGAARSDDGDGNATLRRVVVGSTTDDATRDKGVTAECPEGPAVISGGAVVPHGNDTPGVAVYWSAPYEDNGVNGWWAAAQDTASRSRPWLLQVQAICVEGVATVGNPAGSLPPEVFSPSEGVGI